MKSVLIILSVFAAFYVILKVGKKINWNSEYEVGQVLDEYNGVKVYYNGGVSNIEGRNVSKDGYNIGMKYQCVEFIKRYYYEKLNHKMPDSYGNAIDYFDPSVKDGDVNVKRNLSQFSNQSASLPKEEDIIVFDKTILNPYGHVAIVSKVYNDSIEIIQQNPGVFSHSRESIKYHKSDNHWIIDNSRVLGRLRIINKKF